MRGRYYVAGARKRYPEGRCSTFLRESSYWRARESNYRGFGVGIQSSGIDLGLQHYRTKVLVGAPFEVKTLGEELRINQRDNTQDPESLTYSIRDTSKVEDVQTFEREMQQASTSYILNKNEAKELDKLNCTEQLAFGTRRMVGPDSLGKAVASTVQSEEAKMADLSLCDFTMGGETEGDASTCRKLYHLGKLKRNSNQKQQSRRKCRLAIKLTKLRSC